MHKILIVEADMRVSSYLGILVKELGYKLTGIVTSGEEALKAVEDSTPDLVLMDIMLKGDMDGIETASLIRKSFDIPIVYLTGSSDWITMRRVASTSHYGYLVKPLLVGEVKDAISNALNRHSANFTML